MSIQALRTTLLILTMLLSGVGLAQGGDDSTSKSSIQEIKRSCQDLFRPHSYEVGPYAFERVEPLSVGYHVMPSLFEGGLEGLRQHVSGLSQLSRWVWLGPVHEQTVMVNRYRTPDGGWAETPNDTYYWPSDHTSVASELGGEESLRQLIDQARQQGLEVFMDAVVAHYGYADDGIKVQFEGRWVTIEEISELIRPDNSVDQRDWDELDRSTRPEDILRIQERMAGKRLFGLPGFHHRIDRVKTHLINSYKRFIDMGITGFRVDAVLYVDRTFTAQFINELRAYAAKQGKELTFILEILTGKDDVLHAIADDILRQVNDTSKIYFLDFPGMYEFRRIHTEPGQYHFEWLLGFMSHRLSSGVPYWRLIPTLVNHDFGQVINDPMDEKIMYALSEFLSFQPSLLFHGSEQTGAIGSNREEIDSINPDGDIGRLVNSFNNALADYRAEPEVFMQIHAHIVERDTILLEKRMEDRSIYLFVHKNNQTVSRLLRIANKGAELKILHKAGRGTMRLGPFVSTRLIRSSKIDFYADGKAFFLFEVKTKR